jgi:hypothetical protein
VQYNRPAAAPRGFNGRFAAEKQENALGTQRRGDGPQSAAKAAQNPLYIENNS